MKCVWNISGPCFGEVLNHEVFNGALMVPICDAHFQYHMKIQTLVASGEDIETIIQMPTSDLDHKFEVLKLSGFDLENVKP